jgi:hypothetical protein
MKNKKERETNGEKDHVEKIVIPKTSKEAFFYYLHTPPEYSITMHTLMCVIHASTNFDF